MKTEILGMHCPHCKHEITDNDVDEILADASDDEIMVKGKTLEEQYRVSCPYCDSSLLYNRISTITREYFE